MEERKAAGEDRTKGMGSVRDESNGRFGARLVLDGFQLTGLLLPIFISLLYTPFATPLGYRCTFCQLGSDAGGGKKKRKKEGEKRERKK